MGKCRASETRSSLLSEDDWQDRLGRRRGPHGRRAGDGWQGAEASWGPAEQSQHIRPHRLAPATPSHWASQCLRQVHDPWSCLYLSVVLPWLNCLRDTWASCFKKKKFPSLSSTPGGRCRNLHLHKFTVKFEFQLEDGLGRRKGDLSRK